MKSEIKIAGFGGQGVLSMGKILAYSGLMENKEITWMPAYGPEQRGGTANVTVILSDDPISSPILNTYDMVVALNQQSLDKFESKVKPGGILLRNPQAPHPHRHQGVLHQRDGSHSRDWQQQGIQHDSARRNACAHPYRYNRQCAQSA